VQWLLDGRLQGSSQGSSTLRIALPQAGQHSLTALAKNGAFARISVNVQNPPA
jgi:penicillin-binding protein 1C